MPKNIFYLFILVFCLSSFGFYNPVFLNDRIPKYGYYFLLLFIIGFVMIKGDYYPVSGTIKTAVRLIVFGILFSIVPAYVSWEQDYMMTLQATLQFLPYLLFFFLLKFDTDLQKLERVVVFIGVLTAFVYMLSFAIFPRVLFGAIDEDRVNMDRGFARLAIAGIGFVYLTYFMALNKIVTARRKTIWYAIAGITFIAVVLTLTRQTILSCVVIGLFFFLRKVSLFSKVFLFLGSVSVIFFIVPQLSVVKILMQKTQEQAGAFTEDVRFVGGRYFLLYFSPNWFARIFGNGEAAVGKSDYGNFVQSLKDIYRFYQSDVGFIGFYSKFGLVAVAGWVTTFWKTLTSSFGEDYKYVPMFFLLVLLTGFTSSMPFNQSYMACIAIALYLAERNLTGQVATGLVVRGEYEAAEA